MGRTFSRNRAFVPLLFLLLIGGAAAAPSAETSYRQAKAAFDGGDYNATLAIAGAALPRYGDSDDPWVWRLRIVYADALIGSSKFDDARALLERPLPPKLRATDVEVLRLRGLAIVAYRNGDRKLADRLIREAYPLAQKIPQTLPTVLVVMMTLDVERAAKWGAEALEAARKYGDTQTELRVLGTLGRALANEDRFDEALAMWEPLVAKARAVGNLSFLEKFEGNVGWAYLELGDYEAAGQHFRDAYDGAKRIGAKFDLVPWTYQLGNVALQQNDVDAAQKRYLEAYQVASKDKHQQKAIVLLRLANLALRTGRIADARRYADLARGAADETEQPRAVLMSGRVATAEGKFADAERQLRDVLKKTKSEQTVWETHARLAQLFVKTGNAAKADADFRQAVDSARGIRDSIHDPELRFSFFTAVAELFDSYVDFLVAQNRIEDALSVTEASRAQSLGEVRPREKQRDVRTIARDTRATILCYWLGAEHSYLWVVTPKKVDLVRLAPKREIEYAINGYQADLVVARASLKTSGARGIALWRMLVEPASRAIAPGAHVIVIPSGSLHAFNMETLVVPSPHPHYWIEDAVISTAGSLRLLANGAAKPSAAPRLLLVGNAPPPSKSFRALTHAADEMARVKRYFDRSAVVLEGPRATPSAYRASSPESFTFLHFVAHGVATRQKPLDSAIVLAAEGETFKLYAREIAKETLNARLVTISSCRGAGTRAYAGEGLVGLGWAFLHAGADNVIAALWDVDDSATPELMDRMYAGIRAGRDPAVALRDAKLALVRTAGPFQQPSYWAPFVLYSGS